MPFIAGLAVVFAGISGSHDHRVESQLRTLAAELHVASATVPAADLAVIGHHGSGAAEIVRRMHADGVIAGEYLAGTGGHESVRLVVYSGDGGMRSLSELSLTGHALGAGDLDSLRENLQDDVSAMTAAAGATEKPAPAVVMPAPIAPGPAAAAVKASAEIEMDDETPAALPAPKHAAAPNRASAARIAKETRADSETPPSRHERAPEPPAAPAASPSEDTTAAASDGDAVNVAELEALSAPDASASAAVTAPSESPAVDDLHLRVAVGLGLASRSFTPGPTTVPAYASSAVGAVAVTASVQPTRRLALSGMAERTIEMTTPIDSEMASTSISHWELAADYAVIHGGKIEVMPQVGLGHRAFSVDATDPSQSPAVVYSYAILGARAAAAIGSHVRVHGHAALEPVIGGTDPMEMAFGSATRWAFDVGAAIEVRPWNHLFARVGVDYQRFSWSWNQVGARGAGGAVDSYPSGTLSLGTEY